MYHIIQCKFRAVLITTSEPRLTLIIRNPSTLLLLPAPPLNVLYGQAVWCLADSSHKGETTLNIGNSACCIHYLKCWLQYKLNCQKLNGMH